MGKQTNGTTGRKAKKKIAELQQRVEKEHPLPNSNNNTFFKRIIMLTIIAAAAENNALGKDNDLVWHLPDDFKRFKKLTTGHYIIMGRKTFESFS